MIFAKVIKLGGEWLLEVPIADIPVTLEEI
jgi:hypothetical protein